MYQKWSVERDEVCKSNVVDIRLNYARTLHLQLAK